MKQTTDTGSNTTWAQHEAYVKRLEAVVDAARTAVEVSRSHDSTTQRMVVMRDVLQAALTALDASAGSG